MTTRRSMDSALAPRNDGGADMSGVVAPRHPGSAMATL